MTSPDSSAALSAPLARLDGVRRAFSATVAVDDVTLDVAEGEFLTLLGASGCGKTTLLRMLAGFERPDRGRVYIGGADATDTPPYRRPVNMMFQSYALFPHMTVADNVAFGLRQEGMAKPMRDARVAEMLDLVHLTGLAARKPHQLSGGQAQRVALARSLAKHPRLLLLDEPLAALDRVLREKTQFELMDLQKRVGITFVMVTHDQEEALAMASTIAVMADGRIAQSGPPQAIYRRPASRFVATFLGDANLFEGRVEAAADGGVRIALPALGALVTVAAADAPPPGAAVTVVVRPESLALLDAGASAPASDTILRGTLESVRFEGALRHLVVAVGDARLRIAALGAGTAPQPGVAVAVRWPAGAAVLVRP